jgi:hypothetical protein
METDVNRLIVVTLYTLFVAACNGPGPIVAVGISPVGVPLAMATLPQTKKLPTDHILSAITGRDCSIIHYEGDGSYCVDPPRTVKYSNVYCIKTLGSVECHRRNDPYYDGQTILGSDYPSYSE